MKKKNKILCFCTTWVNFCQLVLDADIHGSKHLKYRGREEILINPSKTDYVSDYDQRFYKDIDPRNQVSEEFSFILDQIVLSERMRDLNLFFCDTIVIKKGVVAYFIFNGEYGKVTQIY